MEKKQSLNLLFIGNSHTYYNDMPLLVKRRVEDEGYSCHVTMLAHRRRASHFFGKGLPAHRPRQGNRPGVQEEEHLKIE